MNINIPIDSMSISEKLRVIEMVWDSIRQAPEDTPSPEWHANELEERTQRLADGSATVSDLSLIHI